MATLNENENPYVGPRTFRPEERAKFFGRSREARDLTALIISNRLVLFYSPSGAGKSSLLNTMVRPILAEAGFELLPTGRVSGYSGADVSAQNIFSYNLLLSLQESEEVVADFTGLTISQFLDNLIQSEDGMHRYDPAYVYPPDTVFKPRVLIIDQFEELITTNTALWLQRTSFFEQLAEAMHLDEQLWVVLALREDYVASFDPYLYLMPNRLRHRYYMERLARPEAMEAIQMPVATIRPFTPEAIELLADNLLHLPAAEGQSQARFAQFVEPVQLQAVCYQMWEELNQQPGAVITTEDVTRFADVTKALTNFYEDTIKKVVAETSVSEILLREWFENELITEAGTRNMVYRGEEMTGNLPTKVADHVRGQFIVSEILRPGGVWYELVHDRFVLPIMTSNQGWRDRQSLLLQAAIAWHESGRSPSKLYLGEQLKDTLNNVNWRSLEPIAIEFLKECGRGNEALAQREAAQQRELAQAQQLAAERQKQVESEARNARRLRTFIIALSVMLLAIMALSIGSFHLRQSAVAAGEAAVAAREVAFLAQEEAQTRAAEAATGQAVAIAAQAVAATGQAVAIAAQAVAEAQGTRISDLATNEANTFATVISQDSSAAATATVLKATAEFLEERVILNVPYLSQDDPLQAGLHEYDGGPTALAMILNSIPNSARMVTTDELYLTYFRGAYSQPRTLFDGTQVSLPVKGRDTVTDLPELQMVAQLEQNIRLRFVNYPSTDPLTDLKDMLRENIPVIVFVDHRNLASVGSSYGPRGSGQNYLVVVGFDFDHIYIHDPANRDSLRCYFKLTNAQFISAWSAPGERNEVYRLVGLVPENLPPLNRLEEPRSRTDC